jgi:hypothetical protein
MDLIDPGTLYWPQNGILSNGIPCLFMSLFHMCCQPACEATLMLRPGRIPLAFVDLMSNQELYDMAEHHMAEHQPTKKQEYVSPLVKDCKHISRSEQNHHSKRKREKILPFQQCTSFKIQILSYNTSDQSGI